MTAPKIRRRFETNTDLLDDDYDGDPADMERDEAWHEKYRIVDDEDEAEQ